MQIPNSLNKYAASCLEALQNSGSGKYISLGGAVGLAHYYEYRTTKDVDAWWTLEATPEAQKSIIALLIGILEKYGEVKVRRFGDVVSIDLIQDGKIVFNFQIASRSVLLRPTIPSPWTDISLDSVDDLVASKMTALIERGAPRDFVDIYTICDKKLITHSQCWELWQEREMKRGVANPDIKLACEALLLHLKRIEKSRPLEIISNDVDRKHAQKVREWFKNEFCKKE